MVNCILRSYVHRTDYAGVLSLVGRRGNRPYITDLDEKLHIPQIRRDCRVWVTPDGRICGLVLVDDYQNLCLDADDDLDFTALLDEALPWAWNVAQQNFAEQALDACEYSDSLRLPILLQKGFIETGLRTYRYVFQPAGHVPEAVVPEGFTIRPLRGEGEVSAWMDLHLAAHPDAQLDRAYRLAMMSAARYRPELDWVMQSPSADLVAYCVGSLEAQPDGSLVGYTDPVAVHPSWHGKGLGKAIMCFCMDQLLKTGAASLEVGTSSGNIAMQRLAESVGFEIAEEKVWLRLEK